MEAAWCPQLKVKLKAQALLVIRRVMQRAVPMEAPHVEFPLRVLRNQLVMEHPASMKNLHSGWY